MFGWFKEHKIIASRFICFAMSLGTMAFIGSCVGLNRHFTATRCVWFVLDRSIYPLNTTPKPPRPSGLDFSTIIKDSSNEGVVFTSLGSFCFNINASMSSNLILIFLTSSCVSGTIKFASLRPHPPNFNRKARKALLANTFIIARMMAGSETTPIAAPMSVVAAGVELICPALLLAGFFARPAAFALFSTMATAVAFHIDETGTEGFPLAVVPQHQVG